MATYSLTSAPSDDVATATVINLTRISKTPSSFVFQAGDPVSIE
jgi:hypothetical protein